MYYMLSLSMTSSDSYSTRSLTRIEEFGINDILKYSQDGKSGMNLYTHGEEAYNCPLADSTSIYTYKDITSIYIYIEVQGRDFW